MNSHLIKALPLLISLLLLTACVTSTPDNSHASSLKRTSFSSLPNAITNNSVALAEVNDELRFYSFLGLERGKDWQDVSKKAFRYSDGRWYRIENVPVEQGRLASIAVTVNNKIYLFGGYTVDADYHEVSTPEVLQFNPVDETYKRVADIPIPSDDSVALVYQNRYIYLVSGWHDKGNINLVQVYDVVEDKWQQATQFPGAAVFGHAGGIVDHHLVICDGVKIAYPSIESATDSRRSFQMSDECYLGEIDESDHLIIHWKVLPNHPGLARYRMAAGGDSNSKKIIFVGGSDNPYNFNGIGYNGVPSEPVSQAFAFDIASLTWEVLGKVNYPTMDHRSLLIHDNKYYTIGGMRDQQQVIPSFYQYQLLQKF